MSRTASSDSCKMKCVEKYRGDIENLDELSGACVIFRMSRCKEDKRRFNLLSCHQTFEYCLHTFTESGGLRAFLMSLGVEFDLGRGGRLVFRQSRYSIRNLIT